MNLTLGIGFSQHENVVQAAEDAAQQVKNQLGSRQLDMILLLTTPQYDPQKALDVIEDGLNHTRIIGGSTPGIIVNGSLKRYGLALFAFRSNTIKLQTIHALHLNLKDLTKSGESFVKETSPAFGQKDRKFLMFFFDGLLENMSEFNSGIQKELGQYFPLVGLGTGDQLSFSKTTQYHDKNPASNSACGAIMGGEVSVHMSQCHGWKPLGKPRLIKKAKKNIIEQIGNAPAIQIYEEFFKDNLGSLKNDIYGKLNAHYPLGILQKGSPEYLMRNVIDILEDGSIVCQDIVKEGDEIHIMLGNKTSCLQSANSAATDLKKAVADKTIRYLFIFESVTRWQILKHAWHEELKMITKVLGSDFPIIGMLTYGELFNPGTLQYANRNSSLNGNIILLAVV